MLFVWIVGLYALFMFDNGNGVFKQGRGPVMCYVCPMGKNCDDRSFDKKLLRPFACSFTFPYCGTHASYPDFKSRLGCSQSSTYPCFFTYDSGYGQRDLQVSCYCKSAYCNNPLTDEMRKNLTDFTSTFYLGNITDFTSDFYKWTGLGKVRYLDDIYKMVTYQLVEHTSNQTRTTRTSPAPYDSTAALDVDEENGLEGSGGASDDPHLWSAASATSARTNLSSSDALLFFKILIYFPLIAFF